MAATARAIPVETAPAPVLAPVTCQMPACGECMFHIPHATRPGGWCACDVADARWQPVTTGQVACGDFTAWPEAVTDDPPSP